MSLINRCYKCNKRVIIPKNLEIMNVKIEYYDCCDYCIKKVKKILTVNLTLPIDILNIIILYILINDDDILNKYYNFISYLDTGSKNNGKQLALLFGFGKSQISRGIPNELKSFRFINNLLQKSDITCLFIIPHLFKNNVNKCYKKFRKELINKNKLEYIFINLSLNSSNFPNIFLIYKPNNKTTTIKVIDYKNKKLIKTININEIINNNYSIDINSFY